MDHSEIRQELHSQLVPLKSTDGLGDFSDLRKLDGVAADRDIYAIGLAERFGRQLTTLRTRLACWLITYHQVRTIALEEDHQIAAAIDAQIDDFDVSVEDLVAKMWKGWRIDSTVGLLQWIREWNLQNTDDRVSLIGTDDRSPEHNRPEPEDLSLAKRALRARSMSPGKTAMLGGMAHTAAALNARISYPPKSAEGDNAGAFLRRELGSRYCSIGVMFNHGQGLFSYPPANVRFAEAALANHGHPAVAIAPGWLQSGAARAWAQSDTMTRLIGPAYDSEADNGFHLAGGNLAGCFDLILHCDRIDPVEMK